MVNSNKILTVSYGTFSCTLEGFDDSFGTMKAIAEYFRDLAAQDRYFGAEPPQPDADMLARIAEREIARRVEARMDGKGIVLRAGTDQAQPAPTAIATAPEDAEPRARANETEADDTADWDAAVDEASIASFFAKPDADRAAAMPVADEDEGIEDPVPGQIEAPAPRAPGSQTAPASVHSTAESIAAKLMRIRSVVAQSEEQRDARAPVATEPRTEDARTPDAAVASPDETPVARDDQADTATAERIRSVLGSSATTATEAIEKHADAAEDTPERAGLDDGDAPHMAGDDEDADQILADVSEGKGGSSVDPDMDDADAEQPAESAPRQQARVIKVGREEFDALLAEAGFDETDEDAEEESSLSPEDEADLMRELAEVEAEVADEQVARKTRAEEDDIMSVFEETALTDDEDDEDDIETLFSEKAAPPTPKAEPQPASDRVSDRVVRAASPAVEDDISRLLAETDRNLGGTESSKRRSDFDHLRAAVAASKAETAAGGEMEKKPSENPYRLDLAQVVRPRRPEPPADARERSRRPEEQAASPLKLVAAQRVDGEQTPVRPRRVTSQPVFEKASGAADDAMSFEEFADRAGAENLPQLLEAAASYLSFVEGRAEFSRPQLMSKVRALEPNEYSREDGLRSFGQLLRDGKIEKIQGGRFTVSDSIGFRPEDLRAAG